MTDQPHLLVGKGDVHDIAILPGDPDRVARIADRCEDSETLTRNREYTLTNARFDGRPVTICSTGVGCPSAAIAVEELANVGVETFIRVGTTGGLQSDIDIGDVIVATAAGKTEGTSKRYESVEFPAVADYNVTEELVDAAKHFDEDIHLGPIVTDDAYYAETGAFIEECESAGILAVEMEAAIIFTLARRKGLRAGAICTVDGNLVKGTQKGVDTDGQELPEAAKRRVGRSIDIALTAATSL